jgi:hypothetical protein
MKKNVTLKKTGFQRDTAVFVAIHTITKDSLIRHCPSRKAWFAPALHSIIPPMDQSSSKFFPRPIAAKIILTGFITVMRLHGVLLLLLLLKALQIQRSFGLPNEFFPLGAVFDAVLPICYFRFCYVGFYIILPPIFRCS